MSEVVDPGHYKRGCVRAILIGLAIAGAAVWGILSLDDSPQNAEHSQDTSSSLEE